MRKTRFILVAIGITMWALPCFGVSPGLTAEDVGAVTAANQAYVTAWLANDPEAVMSTLTDDAVLIPHHGVEPVAGVKAIREFWFPPGSPPAKVTRMVNSVSEVQGSGDLAFVWGRSDLEFTYEGQTFRNEGNYLAVLRKGEDGRWRIARRIWNDPVPETN